MVRVIFTLTQTKYNLFSDAFDNEITIEAEDNLITAAVNDAFQTLDYILSRMKERGKLGVNI